MGKPDWASRDWTDEEWAIIERIVGESPPLTKRQLNRITAITGLVPLPDYYDAAPD
ncbi:hypothetical protein [Mycobacterium sp. 1081908.1]|uniref:hypothetical protein n=1 Tax=Mycobacterium sp. 1081908.1 TaxID=1834066 RepID=UPI000A9C9E0C|nr:hypothetical protein [Mycobacterium sp. 1081908.1]